MGRLIVRHQSDCCPTALLLAATAGLTLAAAAGARADSVTIQYQSAPLAMSGDHLAGALLPAHTHLFVGGISDTGQIVFSTGQPNRGEPELLLQYADGNYTPLVVPANGPASAWAGDVAWPHNVSVERPVGMNAHGDVVFSTGTTFGGSPRGTFRWDAASQHTVPIALKGMPASGQWTFSQPGGVAPAINDRDEIALPAQVKDAAGTYGYGLFYVNPEGQIIPVAVPRQALADGSRISLDGFSQPSIDDAGRIAFLATPQGRAQQNAYLWVQGDLTPLLQVGAPGPAGSKITAIHAVFLNSKNQQALVVATTDRTGSAQYGLYRVHNGQAQAIAAPGQPLLGDGKLQTIQYQARFDDGNVLPTVAVSAANGLGQHAFLATLADGSEAAYRMDADGTLTSIVTSRPAVKPVQITAVKAGASAATPGLRFVAGSRPSLNKQGQIAFTARYGNGPDMLVLMTPVK